MEASYWIIIVLIAIVVVLGSAVIGLYFYHQQPRTLECAIHSLINKTSKMSEQQQQLAADIKLLVAQVNKIGQETSRLQQKIDQLESALNNAGNVSPEVLDALNQLKSSVQIVDDLVADQPTPAEPGSGDAETGGDGSQSGTDPNGSNP